MANKIQLRRGLKSKLPTLSAGEPAYATDSRELFVGTGSGNVNMGGSQWYTGTAMSGTSTTTGAYNYSACPLVKLGDIYLNTSNGNVYQCDTAGSGTTAKWTYQGNIRGAAGSNATVTVDSAMSDTSTNPVQNKVVKAAIDGKANITKNPNATDGDIISTHLTLGTRASDTYGKATFTSGANHRATEQYTACVGGVQNKATASGGIVVGGMNNVVKNYYGAIISGVHATAGSYQVVLGHFNTEGAGGGQDGTTGDALIIGNGSTNATSNAFRVTYAGGVYGKAAYNSTGADYAEMFEWEDGNPLGEDRRGLFAYVVGDKIRLASADDTDRRRMGIISAYPAVVGDNFDDEWCGKYLTDIYGAPLTQTVHHDAVYDDIETTDPETGETTTEHVCIVEECDAEEFILNPDYDPDKEYIPRTKRKEYAYWSFIGKLVVRDDGTCAEGGYCYPGKDGVATACTDTDKGYYVMERLDDNHVRVLVR